MTYAPTINLVHKVQALLTSPDVCIWHFVGACGDVRPFHFWKVEVGPDGERKAVEPSTSFDNFVDMIDAAYACIDPLRIEPETVPNPPGVDFGGESTLAEQDGVSLSARRPARRYEADTGPFIEVGPTIYSLKGVQITRDQFLDLWEPLAAAHAAGNEHDAAAAMAAIAAAAEPRPVGAV